MSIQNSSPTPGFREMGNIPRNEICYLLGNDSLLGCLLCFRGVSQPILPSTCLLFLKLAPYNYETWWFHTILMRCGPVARAQASMFVLPALSLRPHGDNEYLWVTLQFTLAEWRRSIISRTLAVSIKMIRDSCCFLFPDLLNCLHLWMLTW